nr:Gag-Pol polyprotein [Tanacetum cinerariifolium]
METLPKVGKTNALSNPVTSNSVSKPQEPKSVNNDKVISPGMFRINPSKTFREEKHVLNIVRASTRTKPITVSQPPVFTRQDLLINFFWKFMGTVRFGNDHVAAILGFGDLHSKPRLNSMTSGHISLGLDLTYAPSTITTQQPSEGELDLLFKAMYDAYISGQPSATARTVPPAQEPQVHQSSTASTTIADTAPIPTNSSSLATNIQISSQDVDELNLNAMIDGNMFVNPFANSSTSAAASSSQPNVDP